MLDIKLKAQVFAIAAHSAVGQRRKYTGVPYWHHLERVAHLTETVCGTPEQVAAAWLHDTVEDTGVTLEDIREHFGDEVRDLVYWLTDQSLPEDGNRAERKRIDREHLARAPWAAQTIKLADLIDNSQDITQHDPRFARVYLEEKRLLLDAMVGGHSALRTMAEDILAQSLTKLDELEVQEALERMETRDGR